MKHADTSTLAADADQRVADGDAPEGGGATGDEAVPSKVDASTVEPSNPESSKLDRRRWLIAILVGGFVLNLGWRLWIASQLYTPIVFGDESRYLIFARVLSGGPGGYGGDTEATRRAGYALLISPTYWFTHDPIIVHRLVQGINAIINAATFPLAYLFARRVLNTDRRWGLGVAMAAATLPAVTFFAPFALPNAVLTPLLLVWVLLLHRWWTVDGDRARYIAAAGAGAVIGLMYVIHVRALLLLGVHVVAVLLLLVLRRVKLRHAIASGAGAGLLMLVHPVLKAVLHGKVITGGSEPEDRMMSAFTTVDGIIRTGTGATGQLWYVSVGTWGLGAIGLVWIGYRLISDRRQLLRRDYDWQPTLVLTVCLAATMLIAVITTAALPDDGKVNNHIYPGYIIFLAPVWVMVALASLRTAKGRVVARVTVVSLALLLVAWFLIESYSRPLQPIGLPHLFSPIDAPELLFMVGDWRVIHIAKVTAIAVAAIALVGAVFAFRRSRVFAVGIILAVVVVNVFASQASAEQMVKIAHSQDGPQLVRDAGVKVGDVVAVDKTLTVLFNHQREVYWAPFVALDLSRDSVPSNVDYVVGPWYTGESNRDWDGSKEGWTFVTGARGLTWAIWRRNAN